MIKKKNKTLFILIVIGLFSIAIIIPRAFAADGFLNGKPFKELSKLIAENNESITEIKAQIELISLDIFSLKDDISDLSERVAKNEGDIEELRSDLDTLESRFEQLKIATEIQVYVIIEQIRTIFDVIEMHDSALDQVLVNLVMIQYLQTEVMALQGDLISLSTQMANLRDEFNNHGHENLIGYQQISNSESVPREVVGNVMVTCPEGKAVVGGGWSGGTVFKLIENHPLGTRTWIVSASNTTSAAHTLTAYAICVSID